MARRSTEYDQFVMSGQKTRPQSTTTFGDFSAIIQNNEKLANPPEVTPSFSAFSPVAPSPYNGSQPSYGNAPTPASGMAVFSDGYVNKAITGATDEQIKTPATGATDTGYSQFATDYAKKEAQIEGEYARSLPTYGALAEQMAQAGIHGGYSDYLQGVAYAKMQDAKENLRDSYSQFSGVGAGSDTAKELYSNLLSENGDTLAGITDETKYKQWEDSFRAANKGLYSDADVEWTLNNMRNYRQTTLNNAKTSTEDLVKKYGTGEKTSDDILSAYGLSIVKGKDADGNDIEETDDEYEARKAESVRWVLSQAAKDGLIDEKELSATIKSKLAIYDKDFENNTNWKSRGEDIYNSVSTAIDDKKDGVLTDADLQTVLNDAISAMGVSSITLDASPTGGANADVVLTLPGGVKLKADYNGKASETVADYLSSKYGNLPIVVYNDKMYYQNPIERTSDGTYKTEWCVLKTKAGSKGTPEQGDAYFRTVAKIMMVKNEQNAVEGLLKYVNSKTTNSKQTWNITTGKHE